MLLPNDQGEASDAPLDVAGAVTVTAALMLAVYAIVNGNDQGWTSGQTLGLLAGAAALMVAFLVIESRVRAPLVPLRLFRIRSLAASNVIGILWSAAMFAWFFLSALYMQLVLGYTPLEVGLAFLPANLIMAVFSLGLSAKIVMRFGIRGPLAFGMGLVTVGLALFASRPGGRIVHNRRAPEHAVPRSRRRAGVQPRAAGGNERRRSRGVGPCVWRREHGVHDGRRAGTGRAGQPGGIAH